MQREKNWKEQAIVWNGYGIYCYRWLQLVEVNINWMANITLLSKWLDARSLILWWNERGSDKKLRFGLNTKERNMVQWSMNDNGSEMAVLMVSEWMDDGIIGR